MNEKEFTIELEDILRQLFSEKITGLELMYRLARSSIEFAKRGQFDECDIVWKYARRFYSIGRAEFERNLMSGKVWKSDKVRSRK